VDRAESERERAFAANAGAGIVARRAAACGLLVIHLLTDYVYAGTFMTAAARQVGYSTQVRRSVEFCAPSRGDGGAVAVPVAQVVRSRCGHIARRQSASKPGSPM